MSYKGTLVENTAPASEPITLAEVQTHLRLDTTDSSEDSLINQLIPSARKKAETYIDRALINTTFIWYFETFEDKMVMPIGNMSSVSSVKYLDTDAAEQTLASSVYQVDTKHQHGRVVLDDAQSWPSVHGVKVNPIYIEFVAGYGATAADVPDGIKDALLRMVGTLYEMREDCSIDSPHLRTSRLLLDDFSLRFHT